MRKVLSLGFLFVFGNLLAQETFLSNRTADDRNTVYAFSNATIITSPGNIVENGTLVTRGKKILAVGVNVAVPDEAIKVDLQGKYIYPGLIDPYTNYGLPDVIGVRRASGETPQFESKVPQALGWNEHNQSHYDAVDDFSVNTKEAEKLRKMGFTSVSAFRPNGVIRGTAVAVNLSDGPSQEAILKDKASNHFAFKRGASKQLYPNSIMGMVALIRQNYLNAQWYESGADHHNITLESFNENAGLPQVFEANNNKLRVLLADKIGDEFGVQYIILGNGDEYQRVEEVAATKARMILPLTFPDAYDVEDPLEAADISLAMMKHWEMAPANPAMLKEKGIQFAFTSNGLKSDKDFWKNLKKAVDYGLSKQDAIAAVTRIPAELLGITDKVGTLESGKHANFIIASGDLFGNGKILESWVVGDQMIVNKENDESLAGSYRLNIGNAEYSLSLSIEKDKWKSDVKQDTVKLKSKMKFDQTRVTLSIGEGNSAFRLSGWLGEDKISGSGESATGSSVNWTAQKISTPEESGDKNKDSEKPELGNIIYPFVAHGWKEKPAQETYLIQNATVWTMEEGDQPEVKDVLVRSGKIAQVGQNLPASGATIIDGQGMHLTPGIIDEHSHAALSGVNESSQTMVSEVRMYDAVDSEDIDIYRQLAGGVVAAQLLHGSANPVGGQSALVKFRWGSTPEEMSIRGADGFIKFALGENVKQSNRSSEWVNRFPQTRMGVEQVYVDGFTRAKEYEARWKAFETASKSKKGPRHKAPRRDLQLEALLEILNKERFISCHSYVQSEINMLMKVAESFDFRINTFTHILEGYKVADKMAAHGAGGSTFADWWAYKYEVKEAIPYNAALMTQAGVLSAINSDDSEMARRLNQEAAKSVKYGDMDEWESFKMVTINPAKMLHLDDRMGSIKVGKDADLVLWTDHPLSIYAKSHTTMVDGTILYSLEKDQQARNEIAAERARLIQKMREVKAKGGKTQKAKKPEKHDWHCEDFVLVDYITETEE